MTFVIYCQSLPGVALFLGVFGINLPLSMYLAPVTPRLLSIPSPAL